MDAPGNRRPDRLAGLKTRSGCGTVGVGSSPGSAHPILPSRRSRPIARVVAVWLALAGIALGVPLTALAQQLAPPEQRIVQLINQARIAQGLSPLATTPELNASAKAHAADMVQFGYMEHEGRDGSTPQTRARQAGYIAPASSAWLVLEVISARQTPEAAANWLLSDRLHRGVLLRNYWREMGAAFVEGGPYGQMWVVEFGCRPNVLPVVAEPNSSGGVTVRLTNEDCTPTGSGTEVIGRATEVMVSDKPDFDGATWEPFVTSKVLNGGGGNVFVKYRDAKGRETTASNQGPVNPVVITAASASTTTLNGATPPPPAEETQSPAPEPGLFSPKPGFIFQPASK